MSPRVRNVWIEVNIHFKRDPNVYEQARCVILGFVRPFVNTHRRLKQSWHYFQEQCPPNGDRPGEPEIRLRFYGTPTNIATIRTDLGTQLSQLIQAGQLPVTYFHFGKHGGPGRYDGEVEYWGKDWSIAMRQYKNGAEFGLYFLSKHPIQQKPGIPIGRHGHRYVHLLLNQMTARHNYTGYYSLNIPE